MPKLLFRSALGGVLLGALGLAGVAAAGSSGAVFTTDVDGTVNRNHYAETTDVYLNGGPCNASRRSARLPDGWHAYRVTDPRGRFDFSLPEAVEDRMVRVQGGVIVESSDPVDHPLIQTPCGPVVRVGPFRAASRNREYKLWIAPKGSDFARRPSKTDDFRVGGNCRRRTPTKPVDPTPPPPPETNPPTDPTPPPPPPPGPEL